MPDEPTLRIDIRRSARFAALLALAHALALAAAWVSLSGWPRYVVSLGVVLSVAGSLAEVLLLSDRSATSMELRADGRALWRDRAGTWHEGSLGRDHYLSPLLTIVELRPGKGGRKRIVLFAGSAIPEDLRRLRVWLRWLGQPGRASGAEPGGEE